MTDTVFKKLKVEALVAEKIETNHILYHFLCKADICEKLMHLQTLICMDFHIASVSESWR